MVDSSVTRRVAELRQELNYHNTATTSWTIRSSVTTT